MTKSELRRAVLSQRLTLTPEQRHLDDQRRLGRIQQLIGPQLSPNLVVAAYWSFNSEPATHELISWLAQGGATVWLPYDAHTQPTNPRWTRYAGADIDSQASKDNLPTAVSLADVDYVIVPGLAGTPAGARLGRGGGWYDRALPHIPTTAITVLLLNDAEVVDELPVEAHDVAVELIITASRSLHTVMSSNSH